MNGGDTGVGQTGRHAGWCVIQPGESLESYRRHHEVMRSRM